MGERERERKEDSEAIGVTKLSGGRLAEDRRVSVILQSGSKLKERSCHRFTPRQQRRLYKELLEVADFDLISAQTRLT